MTVPDTSGRRKPCASSVAFKFDQQEFAAMVTAHHKLGESHGLQLVNGQGARCIGLVDHREVDSFGVVLCVWKGRRIAVEPIGSIALFSLNMAFTSSLHDVLTASLKCPEYAFICNRI